MPDQLYNLYYRTLKGSATAQELKTAANKKGMKITLREIKEFLKKQEQNQRFQNSAGLGDLFVPVSGKNFTYQADLLFLTQERQVVNVGKKKVRELVWKDPVLVVVEITSRKGYFRSLLNKTTFEVAKAMSSIIEEIYDDGQNIKVVEHDSGKEFEGGDFQRVLEDHDVISQQYPRAENSKTALSKVERLNGTIRRWWNMSFRSRFTPAEAIPLIQEKYNSRKHSSTKVEPKNITKPHEYAKARVEDELRGSDARNNIRENFEKGMKVRIKEPQDIFRKKSEPKWSKQIHTITKQEKFNFKVDKGDKVYRAWELLPVREVQKGPKRVLPKPRQPLPRRTKEIKDLATTLKFPEKIPIPVPAPAPAPPVPIAEPKPDKSLRAVEFPIRGYEWIPPKNKRSKETLRILVKYSHLPEPIIQDPSIFNLGTKKNPQLNLIFAKDLKSNRLFTRYERAYGKQELSD